MNTDTLAIDFGTSNSAAAVASPEGIFRIQLEPGHETLPTAIFLPKGEALRIGSAAGAALIAGDEGRYMRALKSVLGTPLLHESRLIGGKRRTLADIITDFLVEIRTRAETATGMTFHHALSGRPARFHHDPARDKQAEDDLRACYIAAGFHSAAFLPEPEAAAIACGAMGQRGGLGLVVDIGGGTSDFSVFRTGDHGVEILASHGIRLGGTDFDHVVSMAHAMPALGHGGALKRDMGAGLLPVPNAVYVELSTWAKIPFVYTPETRRSVARMVRQATPETRMDRLETVLAEELGHELAFAVERGKIVANSGQDGAIEMGFVEAGLAPVISRTSLDVSLSGYRADLADAAQETINRAGIRAGDIDRVVLVGGSSLMRMVEDIATELCPKAELLRSEVFTAVVDGLALAAQNTRG
ncbi:Hsp70 family protein [Falsirhodobacter sp. alg1]|uniref:Hsp70 family protein n=1 Tax=Falsirhodobacter sp. alg1 TaxID=1472418 RepID=UPI0005EF62D0|nr:Hsp70 family protein [Falsirhodobacter sp. alg1]